jgi:hypothetical protein
MRENTKISTFLHPVEPIYKDELSSEEDTQKALISATEKRLDVDYIAQLLPCGHNLHDECLRPWVERANSCPICRQNFNKVDLVTCIGGKSIPRALELHTLTSYDRSSHLVL